MAKKPTPKKKRLQYTILATITVDPVDTEPVNELLKYCKEYGDAQVKNVRIIREG